MWKAPNRPANRGITQSLNDGMVTVYQTANAALPGYQPIESLTEKYTLEYAERRVGISRYYEALQNNIRIDRVIRVQRADINNQDIAVTEDGTRYRIDQIQSTEDVYPPCLDLSLIRYEEGEE